jgi:hypothetical protein
MVPLFVVHRDKQARWQLQHSGALTLAQMCEQDGLAVGKRKGVMVNVWLALVDVLKLSKAVSELPAEDHASIPLHLLFKSKLCAGKQTHRHIAVVDRSKTARRCLGEPRRYQLVADLCRSGRDEM